MHPQERIAPHWAETKFKAQGMAEVTPFPVLTGHVSSLAPY